MKKRLVSISLILFFVITLFPAVVFAGDEIRVTIDGREVDFPAQPPVIVDGRTLVPMRGVFEALGFDVDWNQDTRTVSLTNAGHNVVISIGSSVFTANGTEHILDVPAEIIGGSTMLPIRAVLESVGYELEWDEATRTIAVTSARLGRGIIVATAFEPLSLAPGQHNLIMDAHMNTMHFNGLFRIDANTLLPVPDLVSSWRVLSDTVFEFELHENVYFHDGTVLTAHDVVASWEFVHQFPFTAPARTSIVDFEAVDARTIRIDTGEPNAMLFQQLAHQGNMIMPRHLIEAGNDFEVNPIGTGPFVFEYWRFGDSLHSIAFENYFDTGRAPRVEYVTWRFILGGNSRMLALELGYADFALLDVNRPTTLTNRDINVAVFPGTSHEKLLLNNDLPQFSNPQVRRALGMAINKEMVSAAGWDGLSFPTWSQVPTVFQGGTDAGVYAFDPQGARAILAELEIDPATLGFNIIASNENRRRMAEVVQTNLAYIGVPVTIERSNLDITLRRTRHGDFEAAFSGFNSHSFLGYVRGVLHSDQAVPGGPNSSNFRNAELDALIDQAAITWDADARIAIYEQISRVANENTPHIPMHLHPIARAFDSRLVAPELCSTGALNLNMMWWRN